MTSSENMLRIIKEFCIVLIAINMIKKLPQANSAALNDAGSRIIGGFNVTPVNKYPMLVTLHQDDGSFFCGGTILSKYHVVTNAGCALYVKLEEPKTYVLAGVYYLGNPDPNYMQRRIIVNKTSHYAYAEDRKGYISNDIAILEVDEAFVWNDYVAPTNLPSPSWTVISETKAVTVGWGWGKNRKPAYDPINPLQEIELPLLTTENCQQKRSFQRFTEDQVCMIGADDTGPCTYDFGGPIFIYNEENEKHIQIGIQVFTETDNCGISNITHFPGGTKVASYINWIVDAIRKCSPVRLIKMH